jgi:phage terminase large subunit
MSRSVNAEFPEKLRFLFAPKRIKCAYGGRGSGKSWGFARALLILGAQKPLRILCAREVQKSIKQSVHTLLADQIQALQLGQFYGVTEAEIRGANGTTFSFSGLAQHTVESIKSFEGVDICWVEEAQTVSKKSWDILTPTIRKPSSEIWVSFNPDLDTDETYRRFVLDPPPFCETVKINWSDNKWFPAELEQERDHCQRASPADYANIWEGECKAAVEGAIYAKEVAESQEKGRVCRVPYDPLLKVHPVFDLGWNDSMSIALCQRVRSEMRIIEYIEDDHQTLDHYSARLKNMNLNWGTLYLPHDGNTKDFKTGKSAREIMTKLGWSVSIVPNLPIESGIKAARMMFGQTYFDKDKTVRLMDCLKRYRRAINTQTNEPGAPLHDEYSHGADCFRYVSLAAESMSNESWGGQINYPNLGII